jgi:hypothetical protein
MPGPPEPRGMSWEGADDPVSQLEARLTSHGVYVDEVERDEGFRLSYESVDAQGGVPQREIGRVVNVFRDVFGDDWGGERIEATVYDLDGEAVGSWHVEREWLRALAEGELSEVEFSRKVVDAIED